MNPDPQTGRLISALLDDPDQPDGEIVAPDGRVYRKRSAPEPGVRATLEVLTDGHPAERVLTIFEPQPTRPAAYPEGVPFIPGSVAVVNESLATNPPSAMVVWPDPPDLDALERAIAESSSADGWTVTAEPKQVVGDVTTPRELRRGEARRLISRLPARGDHPGSIMLMQS